MDPRNPPRVKKPKPLSRRQAFENALVPLVEKGATPAELYELVKCTIGATGIGHLTYQDARDIIFKEDEYEKI
jgi:hypothetical protein